MKNIIEYVTEKKLSETDKKVKQAVDAYFSCACTKDSHFPSFDYNAKQMDDSLKHWFKECVMWVWGVIPEEYHVAFFKYFLRRAAVKTRVKLPEDMSTFDVVYDTWKEDIEKIFKDDAEDKDKKMKEYPEYYSGIKAMF